MGSDSFYKTDPASFNGKAKQHDWTLSEAKSTVPRRCGHPMSRRGNRGDTKPINRNYPSETNEEPNAETTSLVHHRRYYIDDGNTFHPYGIKGNVAHGGAIREYRNGGTA